MQSAHVHSIVILPDWRMQTMLLSDENDFDITPIDFDTQLQPASIDLCLGDTFKVPNTDTFHAYDPMNPKDDDWITDEADDTYLLPAQSFVLAHTIERVTIPNGYVGVVHGRSSWARVGVDPHLGGYIDPGFSGQITLELSNETNRDIIVRPGQRFCQLALHKMSSPAKHPYEGKYQNDEGAHETRLFEDN